MQIKSPEFAVFVTYRNWIIPWTGSSDTLACEAVKTGPQSDAGKVLGNPVFAAVNDGGWYVPNGLMVLSPGAFFLIGFLIWVQRSLSPKLQEAD